MTYMGNIFNHLAKCWYSKCDQILHFC